MKKLFTAAAALLVLCAATLSAQPRENILKVYNWADYIDEDVLAEFPAWYKAQTGEDVKVIYQVFDLNETMISKIERGHEDYDVVCPSEYIIERMLKGEILQPINRDFGNTPDYTVNVAPYVTESFRKLNTDGVDANRYAVGYMWGTTGILYNPKYVTREEASTWDIIRNPKFAGKILIKDSFRDVYPQILQYLKYDQIKAGIVDRDELSMDSSDESIALVEAYMKEVKPLVLGWEADFGKEMMTKEKGWVNFSWSGDAQWAIQEAERVGVELAYEVPQEGSSAWFDGWVIPIYAKNVKAASYWINYMCIPEIAIRNMEAIGYVSVLGTPEILNAMRDDSLEETVDVSYFFGPEATAEKLNPVYYPDASVIARCNMLHDSGARTQYIMEMWSRVKGNNLNAATFVVIGLALLGVIIFAIVKKKNDHTRRKGTKNARRR